MKYLMQGYQSSEPDFDHSEPALSQFKDFMEEIENIELKEIPDDIKFSIINSPNRDHSSILVRLEFYNHTPFLYEISTPLFIIDGKRCIDILFENMDRVYYYVYRFFYKNIEEIRRIYYGRDIIPEIR